MDISDSLRARHMHVLDVIPNTSLTLNILRVMYSSTPVSRAFLASQSSWTSHDSLWVKVILILLMATSLLTYK